MLLDSCYAFSLLLYSSSLNKKFFEEGALIDILWPCPGSAPGLIWPKSQHKCAGHEYFIPTKFGEYPSSVSVVKADFVFLYTYKH